MEQNTNIQSKKIKTCGILPIFPGFYNTIFENSYEHFIEREVDFYREQTGNKNITSDDLDINFKEFNERISKECVDAIQEELIDLYRDGFINVKFLSLDSPFYYNYRNDIIDVEYELNSIFLDNVIATLQEYKKDFDKYIKDNFTSYDGFISFYSNDADEWLNTYLSSNYESFDFCFSTVLDFILKLNDYNTFDLYNKSMEGITHIQSKLIQKEQNINN